MSDQDADGPRRARRSRSRSRSVSEASKTSSETDSESFSETSSDSVQEFDSVEEEIEFYQSKVETLREAESNKSRLLETLLLLGNAYSITERYVDAEEALVEVRTELENVWGWDHLASQWCVNALTRVYELRGKQQDAYHLYDTAIIEVRQVMGREYPWTIELMNNLACLCARNSDIDKAISLFKEVYEAKIHVFGREHRTTFDTLCNLGRIASEEEQDRYRDDLSSSLERLKEKYGDDHASVKTIARHLATLKVHAGNSQEAHEICEGFDIDAQQDWKCSEFHTDELLPPISKEAQPGGSEDKPVESLRKVLDNIPPILGEKVLLTLEWTRRFIMKWTGMDMSTFTDHIASAHLTAWSRVVDPAILLEEACAVGHEDAVQALLEKRKEVDGNKDVVKPDIQRAFRRGVSSGNKSVIQLLLDLDVDVNGIDENGKSALHDAADCGYEAVLSLLLDHGGDATLFDGNADTPMSLALKKNHEPVVRLLMSRTGAILANSISHIRPSTTPKGRSYRCAGENDTGLMATIVHFYVDKRSSKKESSAHVRPIREEHRVQVASAEHLVLNLEGLFDDVLKDRTEYETYPTADFRWIHLPANNMDWIEALMDTIGSNWGDETTFPDVLRDEFWKNQLHNPVHTTVHGRFMKPLCRRIPGCLPEWGSLVAYMPYVHWEAEDTRVEMSKVIKDIVSNQEFGYERLRHAFKKKLRRKLRKREPADDPNKALLEYYLFPELSGSPMHIRRTLDQFQYYMTENTDDRDSDQVISRYFRRRHPGTAPPIMMVDQLWLWILNNRTETIVTSFPQRWGGSTKKRQASEAILDTGNVLDSILHRLKQKNRTPITSVLELSELIMARCLGLNFDKVEWEHERYPYLELFDYSVNYVSNEEVRCFNDFANSGRRRDYLSYRGADKDRSAKEKEEKAEKEKKEKKKKKHEKKKPKEKMVSMDHFKRLVDETTSTMKKSPKKKPEELFDISSEVELMREIKDIQEELNILRNLYNQQEVVLKPFARIIREAKASASSASGNGDAMEGEGPCAPSLVDAVRRHIAYVDQIETNTHRPYHHLEDLLDLKQKQSNVFEARMTRKSGNTITVFTIVTIIFLPASFMAAFFALPIEQYPLAGQNNDRLDLGYAVKYTVVPTVAIAIPFIIFALYVNPILGIMKLVVRPFMRLSKLAVEAAPWVVFFVAVSAKFFWYLLKNIGGVLSILWSCFMLALKVLRLFLLLPLYCRHIYNWIKVYRREKKKTRDDGREWRKRQYITGLILRDFQARRQGKREWEDVEDQRVESITESGDSNGDGTSRHSSIRADEEQQQGTRHGRSESIESHDSRQRPGRQAGAMGETGSRHGQNQD